MQLRNWLIAGTMMAAASVSYAYHAHAGTKADYNVVINTAARTFNGATSTVRNSPDSAQLLYCQTFAASNGTQSATCYARNTALTTVSCSTSSTTLLTAIRSINADSYVSIAYDSAGSCTQVNVWRGSILAPKAL
jgi:hypothetical protein